MFSTLFTIVPLALLATAASAESRPRSVHNSLAKRLSGDLAKRYSNARWSFYDVGLGACGTTNVASDYIVALNQDQFGTTYPSQYCNKQITMSYNGKTATATIMDSCPGCPSGGLDLSRGLFTHFATEDTGIIYGEWSFVDSTATTTTKAATVAATTTSKAAVTTTSSYKAAAVAATTSKTSTSSKAYVATTTSSTKTSVAATTTSASSSKAAASSSKLSSSYASASASASSLASSAAALPSTSATANTTAQITDNLSAINDLLTQLGALILTAAVDDDAN
ncbi:hypothetical protein HYPSUDRAFT_43398 [Hypholoma sublateritium FD-334 SS-4]|uniref:RlpA-like protein double-psi beta-barrel domain-containing protein n=1 Tax=Hypholoma sublateritium (strain FD-334 SS-4) TaxID=945553 RepID=A0A0D2MA91_HYPSF|nr:hypothetical protein HYPSUDRAFT_43398 [Hypholoma sublateritium FD-334 SS-4]